MHDGGDFVGEAGEAGGRVRAELRREVSGRDGFGGEEFAGDEGVREGRREERKEGRGKGKEGRGKGKGKGGEGGL